MNLNIGSNESFKEYKVRLSKNKDIYNISWKEIALLLNKVSGNNYGESTYRKWWKAYQEGLNDRLSTDDLNLEKIELEKEKIKFFDQRKAYKKLIRESSRKESLYQLIDKSLSNVEPFRYEKRYWNLDSNSDNDIFVGLDDIHYGSNISNYLNTYNPEIANDRILFYLEKILKIRKIHNSKDCYVCSNGDLISGRIHRTIEISNCENVIDQVKGVSELISYFLLKLSENFNHVYFSLVHGNHSRIADKNDALKDERLDDLIPWYIKIRLKDIDNFSLIENDLDSTFNIVNIRGLNYLNVHGDYDNFSSVHKIIGMIDEDIYCVHFGHRHHNAFDYSGKQKIIMSGSLMGVDDYCIEKRIYGRAQQMVGICDKNGMFCMYDIDLQNV